ncbi:MAG: hypothetical protein GY918_00580, partial [Gammaproteobacteria bacterium]|nr:hypothetical protein [Gammaproteobacteria bacterium]
MCYSPLFLKTNRIYRIFRNAQTSITQPPLISPQSQLIILSGIICVQILLGVAWSLSSSNNITKTFIPASRDFIIWYCDDGMAPLLLNLLLSVVFMICCTWYAFKTRNFPKNYNESKYIGITMYITCICWAVFLPTYFISSQRESFTRTHLMCIISILIATLNLIGLFGQKIKLLLCPCLVDQDFMRRHPSQA